MVMGLFHDWLVAQRVRIASWGVMHISWRRLATWAAHGIREAFTRPPSSESFKISCSSPNMAFDPGWYMKIAAETTDGDSAKCSNTVIGFDLFWPIPMSALISWDSPNRPFKKRTRKKISSIHPKKAHLRRGKSSSHRFPTHSWCTFNFRPVACQGSSHSVPWKMEEQLEWVSRMSHPPSLKLHRPGCSAVQILRGDVPLVMFF